MKTKSTPKKPEKPSHRITIAFCPLELKTMILSNKVLRPQMIIMM